ncbi:amidohydrolase [Nocardioidaceae bacterium]|nr:amidohydrolase [Nocardioidaceae bacterium]
MPEDLHDRVDATLENLHDELVAVRRDIHAHPELAWREERTTALVAKRMLDAGGRVTELPRSGLTVDLGPEATAETPVVALRADLDGLAMADRGDTGFDSTRVGVAHSCGHDVHTTGLLGAGLALATLADEGLLPHGVRLVFQPAEETMPGGALHAIESGVLTHVRRIFALHCDPTLDVGQVGLREGALTGAADQVVVQLTGEGGHTSRPHLTQDLTYAMAKVVTDLPAALSRRLDPRAGVSLVWGTVRAGDAVNVIPSGGHLGGVLRMLDVEAWDVAEQLVRELVQQLVAPYDVRAEVIYQRGVPPVVNSAAGIAALSRAAHRVVGEAGAVTSVQSLGGEDFGWYLHHVPGAMARLGTRTPGGRTYDLHQGDFAVDERAIGVAAGLLAHTALDC